MRQAEVSAVHGLFTLRSALLPRSSAQVSVATAGRPAVKPETRYLPKRCWCVCLTPKAAGTQARNSGPSMPLMNVHISLLQGDSFLELRSSTLVTRVCRPWFTATSPWNAQDQPRLSVVFIGWLAEYKDRIVSIDLSLLCSGCRVCLALRWQISTG